MPTAIRWRICGPTRRRSTRRCRAARTALPRTRTCAFRARRWAPTFRDTAVDYTGTAIDGCPAHLPVVNGQKYSAYDVAAWSDLWFYSNPVFIEVKGASLVAGVK